MAINLVKGEIKILMETLTEQLNTISQYQGKIPQIEIDIIMANIRKLYERFNDLNNFNKKPVIIKPDVLIYPEQAEIEEKPAKIEDVDKKNNVSETIIEVKEIKTDSTELCEKQEEELLKEENLKQTETKIPDVEHVQKTKNEKTKTADLFSIADKETIADKFKDSSKSVNEKIFSEKNDKTLGEIIGKSSIQNLKSVIGINDKFLFINQLFKGDLQEYNKAIDKLNSCETIDAATVTLEELKAANNWDKNVDTYQKLEDLVIRKFL